jgi:hypothetical protein
MASAAALVPSPAAAQRAALASATPEDRPLQDLVTLAAGYLERYREKLALVRATEHSRQKAILRGPELRDARVRSPEIKTARVLVSDVLWVPSDDSVVLAFYRDVYSVDGKPVRDRGDRLLRLFPEGATESGRVRAAEILDESARFNLGIGYWNTNFPTLPLAFLHPRNRPRFEFRRGNRSKLQGRAVVELEFREVVLPTFTRSRDGKLDFVARGTFWIAVDDGAVLQTDLRYDEASARFRVSYRSDPKLGLSVPDEMRLSQGDSRSLQEIEGVSRYTDYRSGEAEIGPIRFK